MKSISETVKQKMEKVKFRVDFGAWGERGRQIWLEISNPTKRK